MKKLHLTAGCLMAAIALSFLTSAFVDPCYAAWLQAFDQATLEYENDVDFCNGFGNTIVPFAQDGKALCLFEANSSYDGAIGEAADAFELCAGQ